jgi:hypothetical protein
MQQSNILFSRSDIEDITPSTHAGYYNGSMYSFSDNVYKELIGMYGIPSGLKTDTERDTYLVLKHFKQKADVASVTAAIKGMNKIINPNDTKEIFIINKKKNSLGHTLLVLVLFIVLIAVGLILVACLIYVIIAAILLIKHRSGWYYGPFAL